MSMYCPVSGVGCIRSGCTELTKECDREITGEEILYKFDKKIGDMTLRELHEEIVSIFNVLIRNHEAPGGYRDKPIDALKKSWKKGKL